MRFCFQKIIFICLIVVLGGVLFFPDIVLLAETGDLSLLKNEEKMSAPLIIRQGPQIKISGFWQKLFWKPAENQIRGATVVLKKILPKTDKIIDGIESASSKILQAGQTIKSAAANLGGKINNYFQNINTDANIVGFNYPDSPNPATANVLFNILPISDAPQEQLAVAIEPTKTSEIVSQNKTATEPIDRLSVIQGQLNALIEQIDDIAEQTDELIAGQSQIIPRGQPSGESKTLEQSTASIKTLNEPQPSSSEQTTSINPSIPTEKDFPTESTQTQAQKTTLANQITDNRTTIVPPPPPAQILISEVKTESQESLSDEYIELYNPNNSAVDLGGFILRKKTGGGSESVLLSSAKFKGAIPAFGYFLITPQSLSTSSGQVITGNLQYSGLSYYIAQNNSILLYDKYERLLDKVENVLHPRTHSFGRKSSSAISDFEAQLPTPGAENQKDTVIPQITLLTQPDATTSATTAEFSFTANKPDCVFEYQLDNDSLEQKQAPANNSPLFIKFKNLTLGKHSFQIRAMDPVGNWANLLQVIWEITPAPIQPIVPEAKILISEIQIESAASAKDEFIELYNPNDFAVDLANFSLKKKTSSGAESNLVSSSYFTGVIAERGYFLIAPQDKSADLNYSGRDYSVAKDNTVLLYNKNGSLINKLGFGQAADFETSPAQNPNKGYSLGRKWLETENSEQDTDNNQNDFERQIPTPGAKNEKNIAPWQIEITSQPLTLTNQNQATFVFSSPEPNAIFFCKIDADDWQECLSPKSYNELSEGSHIFYLKASDPAGNFCEPIQYTWIVDTAPPVSRLEDLATFSTSTNFIIKWSGTDNLSGILNYDIQYKEGLDGEWRNFSQATTSLQANFTGEDGQTYYFRSKARDIAGNESAWPEEAEVFCKIEIPKDNESAEPVLEVLVASSTTSTALFFSAIQGAENPSSQGLLIKNSGQAEMAWDISVGSPQSWLSLSLTSGTLLAETSINIEIAVDISELEPGNYQATTTITAAGAKNSPQEVQINLLIEEPFNQTPSALFSYSPNENLRVGDEIIFDGSSSTDPDGEITAFIWDFGDGFATTTQSPFISHIFNTTGQFQILLIAQDDKLATSSLVSATLTIGARPESMLLITEIQICGAPICDSSARDHDFVEIFNPNNQVIDISNFQLKKRNSNGTEYSIRVFPAASNIPAQSYFLWANSGYFFPDNFMPDATSTQTIANDNSLALFDDNRNIIDQVAWGLSTNPFMETTPFSQNPSENQTLSRKQDDLGHYIDTNNNATDFILASPTPTNSQGQTSQ